MVLDDDTVRYQKSTTVIVGFFPYPSSFSERKQRSVSAQTCGTKTQISHS